MRSILFFLVSFVISVSWSIKIDFDYHNYVSMTKLLKSINSTHPNLAHLYSVGKSVQGRQLWVMLLSDKPTEEPLLKPNVKYVANMHGNEVRIKLIKLPFRERNHFFVSLFLFPGRWPRVVAAFYRLSPGRLSRR